MKKLKIFYWIFTGLFAAFMIMSAIPDIIIHPEAVKGFEAMDMPKYLIPFVGVAKLLGAVAILVPGFPRLKEWAYAGLFFDLIGAIYSMYSAGIPASSWAPVLLPVAVGIVSYVLYHKKQKAVSPKAI